MYFAHLSPQPLRHHAFKRTPCCSDHGQVKDREAYYIDLQLLRVTKKLQAVLKGDQGDKDKELVQKTEARVEMMGRAHESKVSGYYHWQDTKKSLQTVKIVVRDPPLFITTISASIPQWHRTVKTWAATAGKKLSRRKPLAKRDELCPRPIAHALHRSFRFPYFFAREDSKIKAGERENCATTARAPGRKPAGL